MTDIVIGGSLGDEENLDIARMLYAFKTHKEEYQFNISAEDAKRTLQDLTPWEIDWKKLQQATYPPQSFVLTGVLRNYLQSGMIDIPSEESFDILDSKSAKFRKLHSTI